MNKILILSPHPDDGLLGAGATISRCIEEGNDVSYAIFAPNRQGFEEGETENALMELGLARNKILKNDFPVRQFSENRQKILEWLLKLREEVKPELVLCHSSADCHQDHKTVREEAFRAFKQSSILGYNLPWNTRNFQEDVFVRLVERNVDKKLAAISRIVSQKSKPYYDIETRRAHLKSCGEKIGGGWCEIFESISQVI